MRFKHLCFLILGILASCAPKARVEPESSTQPKEPEYLFAIDNEVVLSKEFLHTLSKNQHLTTAKARLLTQEGCDQHLDMALSCRLNVKDAQARERGRTERFKHQCPIVKEELNTPYLFKDTVEDEQLGK